MLERLVAFVEREWKVLKAAPFAFIMLAALCLCGGFGAGMLYYSGLIGALREQLNAKDGQVNRYRVALGIDQASKGALIELNNQELALKAQSTVAKLRDLGSVLNAKYQDIQKQVDTGKEDKDQAAKDKLSAMQQVSQDFDTNFSSDAYNVEAELFRRLDPSAIAHVVRVPAFVAGGIRLPLTTILRGSGLDTAYLPRLADEIEQMAKLLPPDSGKQ